MKIFVSGATGFIGSRLALRLAEEGYTVHALYRSLDKTMGISHPNIIFFKGDILDLPSLEIAMAGCQEVYHTAAFAKVWDKDPSRIYRLNIEGTMNVIEAGIKCGVKKFVCTSTAGVYGPSGEFNYIDESSPKPEKYFIDYESSKCILEKSIHTICQTGIHVVIVNPTRVYGPGPLNESNSVTRMIKKYLEGKWRVIPGNGKSIGNYVYVNDVVNGHILAMEKGKSGENYILGGSNVSYNEFFEILADEGNKKQKMIHIPLSLMLFISHLMLAFAKLNFHAPLITPPLVRRFIHFWNVSSEKAIEELGYSPMQIREGMKSTINWLTESNAKQ